MTSLSYGLVKGTHKTMLQRRQKQQQNDQKPQKKVTETRSEKLYKEFFFAIQPHRCPPAIVGFVGGWKAREEKKE